MGLLNRFPSFTQLRTGAVEAVSRFPLVMLSAVVSTAIAIILIEYHDYESEYNLQRVLLAASLGLPLFVALVLAAEKHRWSNTASYVVQGLGILLLVAYFFTLPDGLEHFEAVFLRYALLTLGLHALVACLPYLGGRETHGFWQFNMSLLYRFLMAAVYSAALFAGLAIALGAAEHLFGLDVDDETYFQLWVVIVGIFDPWLFLAGVPKDLDALDGATDYPKGLAVFAQYILIPLVALYFVILIAYEAKIIIEWNWPKGWVSELVLWFSVVGLLSTLILYPLRKQAERRWVQKFVSWFFRGLVLLLPLLLLAILRRISDYGVTEPRYLVFAMAVGLIVVTIYFLLSKSKDIRVIPIVLGALAFLGAYGPWSASAVSLSSQMGRLESMLTESGIVVDGVLHEITEQPLFEDQQEMSSIIRYVVNWHGAEPFAAWLGQETLDALGDSVRYTLANDVAEAIGLEYVGRYHQPDDSSFLVMSEGINSQADAFAVTGYDYLVDFELTWAGSFTRGYPLETDSCFVSLDTLSLKLDVFLGQDRTDKSGAIRFDLADVFDSLITRYDSEQMPMQERTFDTANERFELRLALDYLYGDRKEDSIHFNTVEGHILLKRRQ